MDFLTPTLSNANWSTSLVFEDETPEAILHTGQTPPLVLPFSPPRTPETADAEPGLYVRSAVADAEWPLTPINLNQSGFIMTAGIPQYRNAAQQISALCHAARSGDTQGVLAELRQGTDVNVWGYGESGPCTPLIAATESGHASAVKALLRAGADVNLSNGQGRAALYCAAQCGNADMVALLLRQPGIHTGAVMEDGTTALHQAAAGGHVAIAQLLLDVDVVPTVLRRDCLAAACRRGDAAMVDLLFRGDLQADAVTGPGCLHTAAACGHAAVVARLLQKGVAATAAGDDGLTALHHACLSGNVDVVALLLAQPGAYIDNARSYASPPLYLAASAGHVDVVKYLLDAGAAPNATDPRTGRTALMAAAAGRHPGVLQALLSCPHISLNTACGSGWTALQLAMFSGTRDAVIHLLRAGAAVDMPNDYNYRHSLLCRAVGRKDVEMVRLMLAQGGREFSHGMPRCQAAAAHAAESGSVDIVECLLDAGHPGPAPESLVSFISQASTQVLHAASATTLDAPVDYAPAVTICDLPLVRLSTYDLWTSLATTSPLDARSQRLGMFSQLIAPLTSPRGMPADLRENLLLHLHKTGILLAAALPLADCLLLALRGLEHYSAGQHMDRTLQTTMHCATAASMLDLQALNLRVAATYSRAGISANGRARLTGAAQRQLLQLINLAAEAGILLSEDIMAKIMPTCCSQVDGRSFIDSGSLVTELTAGGLLRPLAQVVAASWKDAVAWRLGAPLDIPQGASFQQIRQRMDNAVEKLGKSHLAPAILASLREADMRGPLRENATAARTGEAVHPLLQFQTAQLRRFAERMRQG